jgi:hypothetical protein
MIHHGLPLLLLLLLTLAPLLGAQPRVATVAGVEGHGRHLYFGRHGGDVEWSVRVSVF